MEGLLSRKVTYYKVIGVNKVTDEEITYKSGLMQGEAMQLKRIYSSMVQDKNWEFFAVSTVSKTHEGLRVHFEEFFDCPLEEMDTNIEVEPNEQRKETKSLVNKAIKHSDKFTQDGNQREYDPNVRLQVKGIWTCSPKSAVLNKPKSKPKPKRQTSAGSIAYQLMRDNAGLSKRKAKKAAKKAINF